MKGFEIMGNLSASYDVDMALKYGVEVAALYNKLEYLARYTTREDGYCWRTAEELEKEIGLSKKQQALAIKKLENAGLIYTKVTYIQGTQKRSKHFLLWERQTPKVTKRHFQKIPKVTKRKFLKVTKRHFQKVQKVTFFIIIIIQ